MSALGAIFHRQGQTVERGALERMRNALRLYGGDRDGVADDGCMGVVWTHAIGFTPQDRFERQPIKLAGGGWLAFTGRLDHREELCRALDVPAARGAGLGDDALVRMAWERWAEHAVKHLYGDYSFLIADPARRRLIVVRGPLLSRPIFYYETPDRLVIASMPKGLFALGDVPRELNEERLADALVLNFEDKDASYFKGVCSLPLGHMLVVEPDRLAVTRFYDLRDTAPLRFRRDTDYVDAATELLDAAVANAMRCVETPALGLSSGLDSTTLAVTALDHLARVNNPTAKRLLGIVAVPEPGWDGRARKGRAGDESGPVRALMARYPALDVRFMNSAGLPTDHGLDQVQMAADMPIRGLQNLHWGINSDRQVRADGRRVVLSGISGNGTLSYSAVRVVCAGLFRRGRWVRLLREVRRWNLKQGHRGKSGLGGIIDLAVLPNLPRPVHVALSQMRPDGLGWKRSFAIHPDFARDMRLDERMEALGYNPSRQPRADKATQMARMFDRGNRHQAGAMMMGFEAVTGVQVRDPLGDRKIVEFCYAIPDDQFYRDGIDRWLVRRMMARRLPAEILNAPRGEQAADWHLRLKRDAARFEEELSQFAADPSVASRIDVARLRAALKALPDNTPLTPADHPDLQIARFGFGSAFAMARFVRAIEGRNA